MRTRRYLLSQPRLLLSQTAGAAALALAKWWWLGYAESSVTQLVISALAALALAAGFVWLVVSAVRQLRQAPAPRFMLEFLLFAASLYVAYRLVWWVPAFSSLVAQALSMAVRFGVAYLLVLTGWLSLLASISGGRPRSTQESTVARP